MGVDVSVVIPVYNRERLILDALESVFAQSHAVSEIIVVDDGSTDNTVSNVEALKHASIKVISICNSGCEVARSVGVQNATGTWIAYLDSDDLWEKDHILRLVELRTKYPDCVYLFSNFTEFGNTARLEDKFASMPKEWWPEFHNPDLPDLIRIEDDRFASFLNANPVFPSSSMHLKTLYEKVDGIYPEYSHVRSADADFVRRCAVVAPFACDRMKTVRINKHGDNISADQSVNALGRLHILSDTLARDPLIGRYKPDVEQAICSTAINSILGAFSNRNFNLVGKFKPYISWREMPFEVALRVFISSLMTRVQGARK